MNPARSAWMHLTGQSWMWQNIMCRLGHHRYVEWATYDGPLEWCRFDGRVKPSRRTYMACAAPRCQKPWSES